MKTNMHDLSKAAQSCLEDKQLAMHLTKQDEDANESSTPNKVVQDARDHRRTASFDLLPHPCLTWLITVQANVLLCLQTYCFHGMRIHTGWGLVFICNICVQIEKGDVEAEGRITFGDCWALYFPYLFPRQTLWDRLFKQDELYIELSGMLLC